MLATDTRIDKFIIALLCDIKGKIYSIYDLHCLYKRLLLFLYFCVLESSDIQKCLCVN